MARQLRDVLKLPVADAVSASVDVHHTGLGLRSSLACANFGQLALEFSKASERYEQKAGIGPAIS
jgi:hypothetical protein